MDIPLVSIIVPVYNVEKYLVRCLDSILCQTLKEIEIILVNNGSTDSSLNICNEYSLKDERIKILDLSVADVSSARNAGINAASAPYIGFVDSDDWIDNDMFDLLYDTITQHDADIAICSFSEEYEDRTKVFQNNGKIVVYEREEALRKLFMDREIKSYVWNKLFKRNLFSSVRFPEGIFFEDHSTTYKCFSSAKKIVQINQAKCHYLQRSSSIVHDVCPLNNYHFFLANYERYLFAKECNLFGNDWKAFNSSIVRGAIRQVRKVLLSSQEKDVNGYIDDMKIKLSDFLSISITEIKLKYYLRLRKVLYFWPLYCFTTLGLRKRKRHPGNK